MNVFCPYIRDADYAARSPWKVASRRLLDYLLVWVQEGQCTFTVEGVPHRLKIGDFCLVQPGQSVELVGVTHTVTPYAHFDLWFNARREESFATRPGQLDLQPYLHFLQPRADVLGPIPTIFSPPDGDVFKREWLEVVSLWSAGTMLSRLEAQNQLGELVLRLARHFGEKAGAVSPVSAPFGWVESYLSIHLSEPISVPDMARRARLSPSRFQTVFREHFGISPARYLTQLRVKHAGELLRSTDWTLAHIAMLCGFADVHHFAKTFKRVTGQTPGSLRR